MKGLRWPFLTTMIVVIGSRLHGLPVNAQKAGPRGAIAASEPFPWDAVDPFDYYTFAQIYPAAVCRADVDSCTMPKGSPEWTIHGLWPNYKDGSFPQFCDRRKFVAASVASIRRKLELNWPNLFPEKAIESFWEYEWHKHGTCAKGETLADSETDYFNESLNLHSHLDIFTALFEGGIEQSNRLIQRSTVEHVVSEEVADGKNVQLHCLKDKKSGQWLLADVRICMNLKLRHPIDCPEERLADSERTRQLGNTKERPLPEFTKCPDEFYYPAKDSVLPLAWPTVLCSKTTNSFILGEVIILLIVVLLFSALIVLGCRRFNRPLPVEDSQKSEKENTGKPLLQNVDVHGFINPGMHQITDEKFDAKIPNANTFYWAEKSERKLAT